MSQTIDEMIEDNANQEAYQEILKRNDYRQMTVYHIAHRAAMAFNYPENCGKDVVQAVTQAAAHAYLITYLEARDAYFERHNGLRELMMHYPACYR